MDDADESINTTAVVGCALLDKGEDNDGDEIDETETPQTGSTVAQKHKSGEDRQSGLSKKGK